MKGLWIAVALPGHPLVYDPDVGPANDKQRFQVGEVILAREGDQGSEPRNGPISARHYTWVWYEGVSADKLKQLGPAARLTRIEGGARRTAKQFRAEVKAVATRTVVDKLLGRRKWLQS